MYQLNLKMLNLYTFYYLINNARKCVFLCELNWTFEQTRSKNNAFYLLSQTIKTQNKEYK